RVLVLVPTRELAMQVAEAIYRYGRNLGARVMPIYGGQAITQQLGGLRRGVDVVVATPGRALDHIRRRTLDLGHVEAVVLDEADEMLDMGFAEELEAILSELPARRQTALFTATMPKRISAIAEEKVARGVAPRVRQVTYLVSRAQKVDALGRILDLESPASALVFCRTRGEVETLAQTLNGRGFRAEALHGGMSQKERDRVMGRFREIVQSLAQEFDVLDVAAAAVKLVHEAGDRTEAPRATSPASGARAKEGPPPTGPFARIYVSIGQAAGAQAGDLVGAITGEAKLDGSAMGAVEIEER
ncbi:MAG: hypothetical protein DMF77_14835, partial [Acidobacteria bacterium]